MRPPFEVWAAQEIGQLRAEADALQHALDRYMSQASTSSVNHQRVTPAMVAVRSTVAAGDASPIAKGSKYQPLFAYFDEAGPEGLTTEEVARRMDVEGIPTKRSSLRAFLWNQKELGRLFNRNGRYMAAKYQDTGEPEGETSNSPDLLEGAA